MSEEHPQPCSCALCGGMAQANAAWSQAMQMQANRRGQMAQLQGMTLREASAMHGPHQHQMAQLQGITATRRDVHDRENRLADQCGMLSTENSALLAENARLRRELERLKR